jgi:flavin-dependent dehydrogenase
MSNFPYYITYKGYTVGIHMALREALHCGSALIKYHHLEEEDLSLYETKDNKKQLLIV